MLFESKSSSVNIIRIEIKMLSYYGSQQLNLS